MERVDAARALEALGRTTEDRSTVPIFWDSESNGVLKGKRGKVHTFVIPVSIPIVRHDYMRLRVIGDGRILDEKYQDCHSWYRNFYNWLCSTAGGKNASDAGAFQDGSINGLDTGNNLRSGARPFTQENVNSMEGAAPKTISNYGYVADETRDASGIVVGTGGGAESFDGYVLTTPVAHGVGAGQLYYATSPLPAPDVFADGTHSYPLSRYFDNFEAGAGTITISEVAQYAYLYCNATAYNFMVARDLLDASVDVPFRAILEVTYTYSLDYPGSGSPLRNYHNFLMAQFASLNGWDTDSFGNGQLNMLDTTNAIKPGASTTIGWNRLASMEGNNNGFRQTGHISASMVSGIFIGSGSTAVDFDDYNVDTMITDGTAGGELDWQQAAVPTRSWADPVMTMAHERSFINGSGGNVTVRESGLVGRFLSSSAYNAMICRDVFSDEVIPNGDTLSVIYQLNVTFP